VVESLKDVEGVPSERWRNVSAFYGKGRNTYSIGSESSDLILRGRKLVLEYRNGSPCSSSSAHSTSSTTNLALLDSRASDTKMRKSTIISFACDVEPMDSKTPKVAISFVGTDEHECTYFFEARSFAACAGVESTPQHLGPGGVFGVIILIAVLVYLVGGCVYQRTVMNQRGWKQLPNYSMWSGIFGFFLDFAVILTSSCSRCFPRRRGYGRVSLNGDSRGRGMPSDDENRLIDNLDEEWDE